MTKRKTKHTARLGQHFLVSRQVVADVVRAARITTHDLVLEIGPGKGILTKELLKKAQQVIAIEKDTALVELLKEKFASEIANKKLVLVHDDILAFNPTDHGLRSTAYKLVANIPYYITGAIVEKFLSIHEQPKSMTLLVQKEVAERIVAKDRKESVLSISVKAYGTPRYIRTVKKALFRPQPQVDSAVLHVGCLRPFFQDVDEKIFFETVKKGFAHKRKLLASNLSVERTPLPCGIAENARAENLSVDQWKCLVVEMSYF